MKTVALQDECPEFFIPADQQRKIFKKFTVPGMNFLME
jgi:hypothetical protein